MPTRLVVLIRGVLLRVIVFILVILWYLGSPSGSTQFLVRVPRPSTGQLLTLWLCCWLRQLLQELHLPLKKATVVFCDNVSAVYMTANPVHHRRTKHIEIDIHFVREKVSLGEVRVLHVPSSHQYADIMTKGLPVQLFTDFRSSLGVRDASPATAGGC